MEPTPEGVVKNYRRVRSIHEVQIRSWPFIGLNGAGCRPRCIFLKKPVVIRVLPSNKNGNKIANKKPNLKKNNEAGSANIC